MNGRGSLERLTLDQWQAYVEGHGEATIFHTRAWLDLLVEQYRFPLHLLALKNSGEVVAAAPFLETHRLFGPRKLVSLPFSDSIQLLSASPSAAKAFRERLAGEHIAGIEAIVMRTDKPIEPPRAPAPWVRHRVELARPVAEIQAAFHRSVHTNVRKARRRGLSVAFRKDADAMGIFYRLQLLTRRRLGVPNQPRRFFQRFYDALIATGPGRVAIVSRSGQPVAAGVLLSFNGTTVYKYAAADPRTFGDRPTDLLAATAIDSATGAGEHTFDFGITRADQAGLLRFKDKFATTRVDVFNEAILGTPEPLTELSPSMSVLSFAIRHSPMLICQMVGDLFYRFSP
ncbi:MAG: GNAT family N-acetyltransferase [Planctomycetales bacterium]|nr:GNAT family N-acetyltransferase [Planctomycetales bacterium]